MKELKATLWGDLFKGFNEISQLLNAYRVHIENLNSKGKEEELDDYIHNQMGVLRSICDSHLAKIQHSLTSHIVEWKNKKNNTQEE